ncbi:MAG: disulfide bond formation protein DsbA [Hyphomicrobium sp.]|nr:MAG: disulfide bond formation protein DsbA [Hyphomicrobium sp.]PPD01368.1 MAG: disulfide bond formation protein DsbA [Hyphomicrobium sp.]
MSLYEKFSASWLRRSSMAMAAVLAISAGVYLSLKDSSDAIAETASTAGGNAFTDDQKKAIGDLVKDYLIKNPEILIDVQSALEAKMEKEQSEKLRSFMSENAKEIYRNPESPVAGDPNGDITVVEFFDYNCGYCKRGLSEVQKLIESDKRVRVVFKELPILSKGSEETAKAAFAAKAQGKYWEFHQAMLTIKGQANEASSLKAAETLGLDMTKFKSDMASPAVEAELEKVKELAKKMGINGTPHFLVGDKSIPGAPEDLHSQLETLVTEFRKTGCSYC